MYVIMLLENNNRIKSQYTIYVDLFSPIGLTILLILFFVLLHLETKKVLKYSLKVKCRKVSFGGNINDAYF